MTDTNPDMSRSVSNSNSKLSYDDCVHIFSMYIDSCSVYEIAKEFDVSVSTVVSVLNGTYDD